MDEPKSGMRIAMEGAPTIGERLERYEREIAALRAEIRRLQELNRKLDPYGRGVQEISTEF